MQPTLQTRTGSQCSPPLLTQSCSQCSRSPHPTQSGSSQCSPPLLMHANWEPMQQLIPPEKKTGSQCSTPLMTRAGSQCYQLTIPETNWKPMQLSPPDASWKPMQQVTPADNIKLPNVMHQPWYRIDMSLISRVINGLTDERVFRYNRRTISHTHALRCATSRTHALRCATSHTHALRGEVRRIWNLCFILFTNENKMLTSDDDSGNAESPGSLIYHTRQVVSLC